MKFGIPFVFILIFLLVHCVTSSQTESPEQGRSGKSLRLQYAQELETKVLKVGPAQEISIGQFALQSFSNTSSRFFYSEYFISSQIK